MSLKRHIINTPFIGTLALSFKSWLKRTSRDPSFWISVIVKEPNAQVVQIGSNDGKTFDPLYPLFMSRPNWTGLFVEPVPFLFERLKSNYRDTRRYSFENSVINDGGEVTFYWVDEMATESLEELPPWYDQLGSCKRTHITKLVPILEPFIRESILPGMTLSKLFEKHGIEDVTIFHIDAEGADYKILSQLDLTRIRPQVILYEKRHLTVDEKAAAFRLLNPLYNLYNLGLDILAVKKSPDRGLLVTLMLYPLNVYKINGIRH